MTIPAVEQPIQLPKISRVELGNQLEARLRALPGRPVITVYRGEVAGTPPMLGDASDSPDASGRVAPYVVQFDGTGPTDLERALSRCGEQLRWTPTVTVAAGFATDCLDAADRVWTWLAGWRPSLPGVAAGQMEPPPGFDPGTPRPDRTVTPIRFFVSLSWQIDLTT